MTEMNQQQSLNYVIFTWDRQIHNMALLNMYGWNFQFSPTFCSLEQWCFNTISEQSVKIC